MNRNTAMDGPEAEPRRPDFYAATAVDVYHARDIPRNLSGDGRKIIAALLTGPQDMYMLGLAIGGKATRYGRAFSLLPRLTGMVRNLCEDDAGRIGLVTRDGAGIIGASAPIATGYASQLRMLVLAGLALVGVAGCGVARPASSTAGGGAIYVPVAEASRATPPPIYRAALLSSVSGFAASAIDREHLRTVPARLVVSAADSGPGTLRAALSESAIGGGWITFLPGLPDIVAASAMVVPSGVVVDGRAARVIIRQHGLQVRGSGSVVIKNISIFGGGYIPGRGCAEDQRGEDDALKIVRARGVHIENVSLACFGDGLLDVTEGATDITASRVLFADHIKGALFGASDAATGDSAIRVTLANSFFSGVTYRHPKIRFGYVHVVGVVVAGWVGPAVEASRGARAYIEKSAFLGGPKSTHVVCIDCAGEPIGAAADGGGNVVSANGGRVTMHWAGAVEPPPYKLAADAAEMVVRNAGAK